MLLSHVREAVNEEIKCAACKFGVSGSFKTRFGVGAVSAGRGETQGGLILNKAADLTF